MILKEKNTQEMVDCETGEIIDFIIGTGGNLQLLRDKSELRADAYRHLRELQTLLPFKSPYRVSRCRVFSHGDVMARKFEGQAFYNGLVTCGSFFACPVCQLRIKTRRATELKALTSDFYCMVTVTVPHKVDEPLKVVLKRLKARYKSWRRLPESKILGKRWVRSLEITYGDNGWHPHYHILFFMQDNPDLSQLRHDSCMGVDIRYAGEIQGYVTKGHNLFKEVTGSGKDALFFPLEQLDDFLQTLKGVHSFNKSNRLLSGLSSDADLVKEALDKDSEFLARIGLAQWKIIVSKGLQADLLTALELGINFDDFAKNYLT